MRGQGRIRREVLGGGRASVLMYVGGSETVRTEESKVDVLSGCSGSEEANQELGIRREGETAQGLSAFSTQWQDSGTYGSVGDVMFWCPLAVIGGWRLGAMIWPRKNDWYVAFARMSVR